MKYNEVVCQVRDPLYRGMSQLQDKKVIYVNGSINSLGLCNFDVVFHCAAQSKVNSDPVDIYESNIEFTFKLLNAVANKEKPPRFIFISSIVAPENKTLYAASKLAGETLVQSYANLGLVDGYVLRPCSIAGNRKNGVIYDIVKKVQSDEPTLELFTNSHKPFIHVDQLTSIIIDIAKNTYQDRLLTLSNNPIHVREIADIAMEELGINKPINWGESWPGDTDINIKSDIVLGSSDWAIRKAIKDILND